MASRGERSAPSRSGRTGKSPVRLILVADEKPQRLAKDLEQSAFELIALLERNLSELRRLPRCESGALIADCEELLADVKRDLVALVPLRSE